MVTPQAVDISGGLGQVLVTYDSEDIIDLLLISRITFNAGAGVSRTPALYNGLAARR